MRLARSVVAELVGLFVADWQQTVGILGLIGVSWALVAMTHLAVIGFALGVALMGHLGWITLADAARRLRPAAVEESGAADNAEALGEPVAEAV